MFLIVQILWTREYLQRELTDWFNWDNNPNMFLFSVFRYVKLNGFRVVMGEVEVVCGGDVSVSPSSIPVSSTAG